MSAFWWGVLMLPLIVVGVALAAGIVVWAWYGAEQWFARRTSEANYEPGDSAHQRVTQASWVMAAPKLRRFRLGWGCTLVYIRGINRVDRAAWRAIEDALGRAVAEVDRARETSR